MRKDNGTRNDARRTGGADAREEGTRRRRRRRRKNKGRGERTRSRTGNNAEPPP
jgi:hypothetical protein